MLKKFLKRVKNPFKKGGELPKPLDPNILARGRVLQVKDKDGNKIPVEVETVIGNIANPKFFEINQKYLISLLDFYHQIAGTVPTPEELAEWEGIEFLAAEPILKEENGKKETIH